MLNDFRTPPPDAQKVNAFWIGSQIYCYFGMNAYS